jgi:hypothetical protein
VAIETPKSITPYTKKFISEWMMLLTYEIRTVYDVIWMWIDWCRKYLPVEPEYEVCWRVSEANESQTSYTIEQADIIQYQSYSHSDDMFIILKSNINTDTSIFVFLREKSHDSKYASPKYSSKVVCNSNMTSFKRFESKPVVKIILIYDRLRHR